MKKRNIIIIAALIVVIAVIAVLVLTKPAAQPESADNTGKQSEQSEKKNDGQSENQPDIKPAPLPESETQTVIIDKDKDQKITAVLGVTEVSDDVDDTPSDKKPGKTSEPTSAPVNTAKPDPTPTPSDVPLPSDPSKLKYEEFYALSPEQKDDFLHSFESYDAFYDWLIDAQAKFTKEYPDIEIGTDGTIDLSKLKK